MEQHQIPRNISSFQFHLIGDMTVKQFGYCIAGVVLGFVVYKIMPFPSIINISIGICIGLFGAAMAFLPVQERPLDKWLAAFIKSILSPTQYLWHKEGILPEILYTHSVNYIPVKQLTQTQEQNHEYAKQKLASYLAAIPSSVHSNLNLNEKKYIDSTLSLFNTVNINIPKAVIPENLTALELEHANTPVKLETDNILQKTSQPKPEQKQVTFLHLIQTV